MRGASVGDSAEARTAVTLLLREGGGQNYEDRGDLQRYDVYTDMTS